MLKLIRERYGLTFFAINYCGGALTAATAVDTNESLMSEVSNDTCVFFLGSHLKDTGKTFSYPPCTSWRAAGANLIV